MRIMICLILSAVRLLCGCAPGMRLRNLAPPERPIQSAIVVPAGSVPENNFRTYAKGVDAGAGKGALSGALAGAGKLSLGTIGGLAQIGGPIGAIVGIYLLPYTLAAGAL